MAVALNHEPLPPSLPMFAQLMVAGEPRVTPRASRVATAPLILVTWLGPT